MVITGGLHKDYKGSYTNEYLVRYICADNGVEKYFRIGYVTKTSHTKLNIDKLIFRHMGVTVVNKERGDLDKLTAALKDSVREAVASKQ